MADHTRAARLAATALDFDLTSEERVELELHRAECVRCRQIEDDFRTDAAALHGLPRRDAPSQLRRAVGEAAWREAQPHRSRTGLILLVAAILMLAMAIGGGLAASQWLRRDEGAPGPTSTLSSVVSDQVQPDRLTRVPSDDLRPMDGDAHLFPSFIRRRPGGTRRSAPRADPDPAEGLPRAAGRSAGRACP
jgi:hypothetical protein